MGKSEALLELVQEIEQKNITPVLREASTQLVMGDGNLDTNIVFIGEAPGKNEDEQGIPFVGAAGKLLNQMLESISLDRSDVYITNIVKYRPPDNRDPLPAEKRAFWPYLVRQLQIINPSIVVTLGRHSMEYFLPEMKIGQIHGEPKRIEFGDKKLIIVPLYHPAAALYNPGQRQMLFDDFSRLPAIVAKA